MRSAPGAAEPGTVPGEAPGTGETSRESVGKHDLRRKRKDRRDEADAGGLCRLRRAERARGHDRELRAGHQAYGHGPAGPGSR